MEEGEKGGEGGGLWRKGINTLFFFLFFFFGGGEDVGVKSLVRGKKKYFLLLPFIPFNTRLSKGETLFDLAQRIIPGERTQNEFPKLFFFFC